MPEVQHGACDFLKCWKLPSGCLECGSSACAYNNTNQRHMASRPDCRRLLADRQPYAVFIDNNLGSNREYLRELCHALRPLHQIASH